MRKINFERFRQKNIIILTTFEVLRCTLTICARFGFEYRHNDWAIREHIFLKEIKFLLFKNIQKRYYSMCVWEFK